MSYIVPREKPKCYNCPFRTLDYCGLLIEHDCVTVNVNEMTVSKYCPLVEIPTPHGRLGDLDKLKAKFRHSEKDDEVDKAWNSAVRRIIAQAETIIEPEGSEET